MGNALLGIESMEFPLSYLQIEMFQCYIPIKYIFIGLYILT